MGIRQLTPRFDDLRAMVRLGLPMVVVQVGMMLLGVVDTMVVGRHSAEALAAVALGHVMIVSVSCFSLGVLMALDPLVSQAAGAGDTEGVRRAVQRGLVLAGLLMIPTSLILLPARPMLSWLEQPPETVPLAAGYIHICIPGLFPYLVFFAFRQTLQALGRLKPVVTTIVVVNIFNLGADWLFVFGGGPVPALGPLGSAWATTASRTLLFVVLAVLARRELAPMLQRLEPAALQIAPLWRTFRLGFPIGVQITFEIVAFGVIALLMGRFGSIEMAAHQVAINLASLTFMVPLGVATASSVRVGHAIGAGRPAEAKRAAASGLVVGVAFMAMTGGLFVGVPRLLAGLYTSVPEVVALAAALIPIAGFFQVFDGIQAVSAGILRGAGDTRAPMVVNLIGFWCFGLPVSLWLAFRMDFGPSGLWWGLVAALAIVATVLLARVVWRMRRSLQRINVEGSSL